MDEAHVKAITLSYVRRENSRRRKPIVTAEFSLGSSGVRADLAVFADFSFGFEIKTAQDTLRRLPAQMDAYARYFNRVIAVVAECHVPSITDDFLCGASLWTYDNQGVITVVRNGTYNAVDTVALQDVLTQTERRKGDFRAAMEARYGETSRQFWLTVGRRTIRPDDLRFLSRFAEGREQARRWADERKTWWSHWLAAQDDVIASST